MSEQDEEQLVELLSVSDPGLLAVLRSALDGAAIEYVVQGEEAMSMLPLPSLTTLTKRGLGAVILVAAKDRAEALAIVEVEGDEGAETSDDE